MKLSVKRFLPRSLMGRSLIILITPVLLIQMITVFIFFDRHWNKMTDRLAFAVAGEIAIFADQIEQGADADEVRQILGYAAQELELLINYERDARVDHLEEEDAREISVVARTLGGALDAQVRRPYRIDVDVREKWVEVSIQLQDGVLHVSSPQRRLFSSSGYIFLLWMIASSLILLAIAILFMRNQIRPIRRLAVAAERFGKGREVPASFKPEGAREVRQAAKAFLDMHERIRRQIQQRTAMLAGVSHDLRTPLTRMKLQVAMMDPGSDLEALKTDISDMERMIDAYLDFVRGEGGESSVNTDLKQLIERVVYGFQRQGVQIDFTMDKEISLSLRPLAFERAVSNVVNNARKFAGHIWVEVTEQEDYVCILIDDNGPGIPQEERDDVFKPFYRSEPSRNPATGGVGLGLPITQDIILGHGGNIILGDSPYGGLRFMIQVPR